MFSIKVSNLHSIKRTIDRFVKNLRDLYGESLISVVLYGSAASGEYEGRNSNINIAVILKDASLVSLSKMSKFINRREFSAISPIFLTEDYMRRSTDVFPIEFIDMKENNVVLHGKDILKDLNIDIKNLRFQCEQELKSKIISLKKVYLRTTNEAALKRLLFKSVTSGIHILRNLIRLKARKPAYVKEDALNEISEEFGVDLVALGRILDAKSKNRKLSYREADSLFVRFVETLEAITDKVDRL